MYRTSHQGSFHGKGLLQQMPFYAIVCYLDMRDTVDTGDTRNAKDAKDTRPSNHPSLIDFKFLYKKI